jgi:predicted dehydrogenase
LDDYVSLVTVKDGRKKEKRIPQDKGWKNEMKIFASAIREGAQPPIPYEQLIGVTRATFAAMESLRTQSTIKMSK